MVPSHWNGHIFYNLKFSYHSSCMLSFIIHTFIPLILVFFWEVKFLLFFQDNSICRQIDWDTNEEYLSAWRESRTGYPYIDAIMAQLREEGCIHHLARHSVACFLTRGDLYISWEEGKFFSPLKVRFTDGMVYILVVYIFIKGSNAFI